MDPKKLLDDAAEYSAKGALRGYRMIGPMGQAVISPRGQVYLAASVERGIYVEGVKEGWRLAGLAAKPAPEPKAPKAEKLAP